MPLRQFVRLTLSMSLLGLLAGSSWAYEVVALDGRSWEISSIEQRPGRLALIDHESVWEIPNDEVDYRETFRRNLDLEGGVLLAFHTGASLRCTAATWSEKSLRVELERGGELAFPLGAIDFGRSVRESLAEGADKRSTSPPLMEAAASSDPQTLSGRRGKRPPSPAGRGVPAEPGAAMKQAMNAVKRSSPAGAEAHAATEAATVATNSKSWVVTATLMERRPMSALSVELGYPSNCALASPRKSPGFRRFGSKLPGEVEIESPGTAPLRISGRTAPGATVEGPARFLRAVFRCSDAGRDDPVFELLSASAEEASTGNELALKVTLQVVTR